MCGHVDTIVCTCLWKSKVGNGCLSSIASHLVFIFNYVYVCVGGRRDVSVQWPWRTKEGVRSPEAGVR